MTRTRIVSLALAGVALSTVSGCVIVADSTGSDYTGYGSVERAELQSLVAANGQNRLGEDEAVVLGRFPAEHVSLVQSQIDGQGREVTVYRVYAKERSRSTRFERYLVFRDGRLALLTDDRDDVPASLGLDSSD